MECYVLAFSVCDCEYKTGTNSISKIKISVKLDTILLVIGEEWISWHSPVITFSLLTLD